MRAITFREHCQMVDSAVAAIAASDPETARGSRKMAQEWRTRLFEAVDPDILIGVAGIAITALANAKAIGSMDAILDAREAKVMREALAMFEPIPFREVRAFDRLVTTALKIERRRDADSPALARLTGLKEATQAAIDEGLDLRMAEPGNPLGERLRAASDSMFNGKEGK